jgi:hypothetical protein
MSPSPSRLAPPNRHRLTTCYPSTWVLTRPGLVSGLGYLEQTPTVAGFPRLEESSPSNRIYSDVLSTLLQKKSAPEGALLSSVLSESSQKRRKAFGA